MSRVDDDKARSTRQQLHDAITHGSVHTVFELIQQGNTNIDASDKKGCTALHLAAKLGHDSIVELLVQFGSKAIDKPDGYGITPIHYAAQYGFATMVVLLVQLGCTTINARLLLETKKHRVLRCQEIHTRF